MDIIQRNFLKLLRIGVFDKKEPIEPMSGWKWNKLYKIAVAHDVTPWIADGIRKCSGDFFLRIQPELMALFEKDRLRPTIEPESTELTNPLLKRQLEQITVAAVNSKPTYMVLRQLLNITQQLMTEGNGLYQLVLLGIYLRTNKSSIDYDALKSWIQQLHMQRIVRVEGALLVEMLGFDKEEIHFTDVNMPARLKKLAEDMLSQDKSLQYMYYFPSEALTNYASTIIRNIRNIEE